MQTVGHVAWRLEKYFNAAVEGRGLVVPAELARFKLDSVYIDFVRRVVIQKSIEL
jgi:hypothetical protein